MQGTQIQMFFTKSLRLTLSSQIGTLAHCIGKGSLTSRSQQRAEIPPSWQPHCRYFPLYLRTLKMLKWKMVN